MITFRTPTRGIIYLSVGFVSGLICVFLSEKILGVENSLLGITIFGAGGYGGVKLIEKILGPEPEEAIPAPPEEYVDPLPPMPEWETNSLTTYGSANWDHPKRLRDIDTEGYQRGKPSYYLGGGHGMNQIQTLTHAVTIAGSGQGKGVCLILPNLLHNPFCSWFVLDPKGENAMITAKWQQKIGQRVILLDPWNEQKRLGATHGIEPVGFNPLDFVKGNPDEMPESCGVIAEMLVMDNPRASDKYWESRARSLIKTYLLHLITARPTEEQHLGTLYRWLRLPVNERQNLWADMLKNLACDELVKSGIGEFAGMNEDSGPLPSIISTAQDNTTFLESMQLRASLQKGEFDPYDLTNGKTTVYLCLPERFLNSHARWLRLVVGVCLKACNYRPGERVNFLLDEFAILGRMQDVERAFAFARGQNISVWIFVQSLTQLIDIYGEHAANAFLSNARLRQFFGVYDLQTQKYLSEYLGETTVVSLVKSESSTSGGSSGTSTGSSSGWSAGGNTGGSNNGTSSGNNWSSSETTNHQPIARRLLTTEEVGKAKSIITLIDGQKFLLPRLPFWDNIYKAHYEGRATYYPRSLDDWQRFYNGMTIENYPRMGMTNFKAHADGHFVKGQAKQTYQNLIKGPTPSYLEDAPGYYFGDADNSDTTKKLDAGDGLDQTVGNVV
ncbi:type IV secretory system conjugative DNA transfer family protein [Larkinella humicola]|uniref:TraM recognition domain-containing protein n=1 Tax=Larkinella humicola TaxID=2607654 RepID=A0A5N1J5J9_9BACT|nr:type IV secretory system conjugative DNA transfer family protein [Larkinella humicola]KAA9340349.1 TraM recognition domain-containing protein [Larkinella humicola]